MIDISTEDKEFVHRLNRMDAEVEAGKVLVPALRDYPSMLYRDDQGKYVLSTGEIYTRCGSVQEIFRNVHGLVHDGNLSSNQVIIARCTIALYASWQVLDTSLPAQFAKGQTLLSLRHELEEGQTVSPIPIVGNPYCVHPNSEAGDLHSGLIVCSPDPRIGVLASYNDVDDLFACNLHTHFPIWIVGKSPQYKAMEESYLAGRRRHEAEEARIAAAPPRMMEVSEREYLEILDWRSHALEMQDSVTDDDALPDDPFYP